MEILDELLNSTGEWLKGTGDMSDIVISSRIRLARNLQQTPFPSRATLEDREMVLELLHKAQTTQQSLSQTIFLDMEKITALDRQFLMERHLVSQEHSVFVKKKGLIFNREETLSIMINEEDHLRIQAIRSGFTIFEVWDTINKVDDELSGMIPYAFMPDVGYLTSCPTNAGTGIRASCMLHLPALVMTKRINKVLELVAKLAFATRGLFGEGTQALGNFFQISNQVSLGVSEPEIFNNLSGVIKQIREQELQARELLMTKYKMSLEDSVYRAVGLLTHARLMASTETLHHLSVLRLGVDLGIITGIKTELVNNLFIITQPAHLQKIKGKRLTEEERDYNRASILREKLKEGQ